MAKGELHVHLEGSLEPETLLEIDPSLTPGAIRENTAYNNFEGFLKAFVWENRLLKKPEHYGLAARRLIERLKDQGVVYAEITLSAGVVIWKRQDLAAVYEAVREESRRAPFPVYWILDAVRQFGAEAARPVVEFAAGKVNDGVAAFGIGGDEARGPASWFQEVFAEAGSAGLRLVCHAGETCGPESIWQAINVGAERIGHGITAIEDKKLLDYLRERDIPLEISIMSNIRTGVSTLQGHPVRRLFDAGVPIVLNTDDPALFETTLDGEYELAATHFGFSSAELAQLALNSLRYGFRR